jgi:hypothetical protein
MRVILKHSSGVDTLPGHDETIDASLERLVEDSAIATAEGGALYQLIDLPLRWRSVKIARAEQPRTEGTTVLHYERQGAFDCCGRENAHRDGILSVVGPTKFVDGLFPPKAETPVAEKFE